MSNTRTVAVIHRYRDGYRVAKAIVAIGSTIKVVGFILAGLMALFGLLAGGSNLGAAGTFAGLLGALILGGIVALVFWLCGVIVSAQGQILMATLDSAVGRSPFLSDDDRAAVMSLPSSVADAEFVEVAATAGLAGVGQPITVRPRIAPDERAITCPQCGVDNPSSSFYCANCRRNLHM